MKRADAIIAYTNGVKKMLIGKDIDENMIFVSSNTLNVEELIRLNKTTQISEINNLKEDLSLQGEKVITFVGRIVPEKKIEYFFQLFERLNQCAPHKYLGLIIGDGKLLEKHKKVNFEKEITNIKFLGRQSIEQTSKYLMFSDLVFIPGMTGLAIVHAFSFGVPYATLNFDIHSPEIEYLRHGVNGLLTMPETFVEDISALLTNKGQLQRMKIEALRTAQNELSAEKQLQGFIEAIHYVCN
ncbi:MAG: glycosyltransferase [Bacteroidetes bacterium]|nr:glycosyltransferase [Bacteroidota bacterium]